jgi:AAA family ATP:ADP antiporter
MAGNLFVRSYATTWSTESLILLVFPSLALMSALTVPLGRAFMRRREALERSAEELEREPKDTEGAPATRAEGEAKRSDLISGLKVIARSDYLIWVLWLVLISQIAVTLIDYQYKAYLRELYPNTDARTAFQGLLYLSIDVGSLLMQLMTGLILSALGVGVTLSLIPLILLALSLSPAVLPVMLAIASAKSASKFLTYSIFKSAKELLYFPLSYEEQTQGKAVIDILIYRQAKILASVLLLTLGALGWGLEEVKWLTALSLCLWLIGALMLLRATRRAQVDR